MGADFQSHGAGLKATSRTFGECRSFRDVEDTPSFDGFIKDRRVFRPAANDLSLGRCEFHISANSADEPATANCYEYRVQWRELTQELKSDGALTRHNLSIVIRGDE